MKKIAVSVIKLIIINIILNLIINAVKYALDVEINEIVAYIIYFIENLIIIFIGVKILWQKFNVETVKKIVYIVTVIFILYNIFSVAMAITQYETITNSGLFRSSDECEAKENIAEEIADVMIMLKQFRVYYNISDKTINTIMRKKIKRQLERIKNEVKE